MKYHKFDYYLNDEWRTGCYDDLNKDCKDIVGDLMNSSRVCQYWSEEKKQMYFSRVVTVTYELGRNKKRNKLTKALLSLRDKIFILMYKLIYVP